MKKSLIGALALVSALGYSQVLFETGFEAGEGYALGSISGQNGWSADSGTANVVDTTVADGTQSLQVPGTGWFWPNLGYNHSTATNKVLIVRWDMFIPSAGTPGSYGIDIYTDVVERVAAMRVNATGSVDYIHFAGGTTSTVVNTGAPVAYDTWNRFHMALDFQAGTWIGKVNGVQVGGDNTIRTGISTVIGDADVQGVAAGTGGGFFDNYKAEAAPVPEPATMIALGMGALGIAARRRRKA